jgi:tetratricopeptide (TPR) repeat protein
MNVICRPHIERTNQVTPVLPLPHDIYEKRIENGKIFREAKSKGDYISAEQALLRSWELFPEPKYRWDSSQSFIKTVGEFYLEWRRYHEAERWATNIFKCDPLPNDPAPYILLGKIYYESGRNDLAKKNLTKAFELGGRRGFVGENSKYMEFAQEQMKNR